MPTIISVLCGYFFIKYIDNKRMPTIIIDKLQISNMPVTKLSPNETNKLKKSNIITNTQNNIDTDT